MATPEFNENCHCVQNDPHRCKIKLEKFHFDTLCCFGVIKESLSGGGGGIRDRVKANLNLEKYLTCVSVRAHRVALAKFRTSAHQLRVETGRYRKLEDKDRICLLCDSGEYKSEMHF